MYPRDQLLLSSHIRQVHRQHKNPTYLRGWSFSIEVDTEVGSLVAMGRYGNDLTQDSCVSPMSCTQHVTRTPRESRESRAHLVRVLCVSRTPRSHLTYDSGDNVTWSHTCDKARDGSAFTTGTRYYAKVWHFNANKVMEVRYEPWPGDARFDRWVSSGLSAVQPPLNSTAPRARCRWGLDSWGTRQNDKEIPCPAYQGE